MSAPDSLGATHLHLMSKQTQLDRFSRQVAAMAPDQRRSAAVAGQRFVVRLGRSCILGIFHEISISNIFNFINEKEIRIQILDGAGVKEDSRNATPAEP